LDSTSAINELSWSRKTRKKEGKRGKKERKEKIREGKKGNKEVKGVHVTNRVGLCGVKGKTVGEK